MNVIEKTHQMKLRLLAILSFSVLVVSCTKNPITNRRQFKLLPESSLQSMAAGQYQQFLSENKVVTSNTNRDAEMVRRVGQRITKAVTEYYTSIGREKDLEGYKYNLVDSKDVNAWCMPGGKIVVYTGLLPITQNEAALAVVMGHEVSHALFSHGNERMSQGLVAMGLQEGLNIALQNKPQETRNLFLTAFGLGTQLGVLLPFSRKDEYESDHYGLWWAAMAGYNPQEAIPLWERMEKAGGGQKPPEFLSTHPSDETRINDIQTKYLPEAMKYYKH